MTMSANRAKADTSPRIPVDNEIAFRAPIRLTKAKTQTEFELCTFPHGIEEEVR